VLQFLDVLASPAKERHPYHPEGVERSHDCDDDSNCKERPCKLVARFKHCGKDRVLAPETRSEQWRACKRKAGQHHKDIRLPHVLLQATHVRHEPGTYSVQQCSSTHKERRLEQSVAHQVEEPGSITIYKVE